MNRNPSFVALLALTACTQSPSSVRITQDEPASKAQPAPPRVSKSEPVFYNGKTYKVDLSPLGTGAYAVAVYGMAASQQKDALGLTTSAFHHFTCKDSQTTKFISKPSYLAGQWMATVRCG